MWHRLKRSFAVMLLPALEYARASTVSDAVELLATPNARVLAGGQTLVNVLKLRIIAPDRLVDVTRVGELRQIVRDDAMLTVGAAVTYQELVESPDVWHARPVLAEAASIIADQQVRNRGTIGGNVCLNLPTNHFPPVMRALDARFSITGPQGERTVDAADFFETVFTTAVREGELLTRISVPARGPGEGDAFAALSLGKEGMSIVAAAASVRLEEGRIARARLALGCVGTAPVRTGAVEERLVGAEAGPASVDAAVAGLGETLRPPDDVNASGDYRQRMAEVYARRALVAAIQKAGS
jgi:carbon-monoxide dehydrogenase medium subunit